MRLVVEELGDPYVENLGEAVRRDEDLGGRQVAMRYLTPMSDLDRIDDLKEKQDLVADGTVGSELVDWSTAFDLLHDQVGRVGRSRATVDGAGDGGMFEHRHNARFGLKAAGGLWIRKFPVQFERGVLGEALIVPLDQQTRPIPPSSRSRRTSHGPMRCPLSGSWMANGDITGAPKRSSFSE